MLVPDSTCLSQSTAGRASVVLPDYQDRAKSSGGQRKAVSMLNELLSLNLTTSSTWHLELSASAGSSGYLMLGPAVEKQGLSWDEEWSWGPSPTSL